MFLGNPHSSILRFGPTTITLLPEKSTRLPKRFCLKRPCLPLMISLSDFKGRLLAPLTALVLRPLSKSTSTASCSILFSLRTMISGAPSSIKRFKRWLRLMTRRYNSFTSLTANFPPSSATKGLKSGGNTGKTVSIIHSGLLPEFKKLSTTFKRLMSFFFFASELVSFTSSFKLCNKVIKSISSSKSLIASPPICATKPLSSYLREIF